MNKYSITFLICILNFNAIHPLLREWKYKPIVEIMTPQKLKQRDELCCDDDIFHQIMQQNNISTQPITHREKNWTCHQYTISQVLGYGISLTSIDEDFPTFYKYFKQVKKGQDGDIAFYVDQNRQLLHSGVLKNLRIRSKWGDIEYICDHDFFIAPDVYKNTIALFRLRSKYNNLAGKEEAACQFYYDFITARYHSRSTHNSAEKPKTYDQFIQNKFPNIKIKCS